MTSLTSPVNLEDLVAYADGQLSPAREHEVACYLAEHPEAMQQMESYRRQTEELHRLFDPTLATPIPQTLMASASRVTSHRNDAPRHPFWRSGSVAAAVAWLAVGGALGWLTRAWQTPAGDLTALAQQHALINQAAIAHVVYAPEVIHPVEVKAADEAHLAKWLSKRLGKTMIVPSFTRQGFALVGGRLLPADQGAAAQFMYENKDGKRITLYVRAMAKKEIDTSFRYSVRDGLGVFYWIDHDWGYALSGRFDRSELLDLADAAYRQFNG